MNRRLYLILAFVGLGQMLPLHACDVCGCVSSSGYTGFIQGMQGHMIGARTRFQHFRHPASSFHETGQVQVREDLQVALDVWGRWQPHARWQVWATLPVKHHVRLDEEGWSGATGLGDGQLSFLWEAVKKEDTAKSSVFRWWLGGGVQLPTGRMGLRDRFGLLFPMWFQPGTGVFGLMAQSTALWQKDAWGVQSDVRVKHSFAHMNGDQPGLQGGLNLMAFRSFTRETGTWMPQLGFGLDFFEKDRVNGVRDDASGGLFGFGQVGLDWMGRNWFFQGQIRIPVVQVRPETQPGNTLVSWLGVGYRW